MSPRPKKRPTSSGSGASAQPKQAVISTALSQVLTGQALRPTATPAGAGRPKKASTASRPKQSAMPPLQGTSSRPVSVPSAEEMDDETFFKHYNARHVPNDATHGAVRYSPTLTAGLVGTLRAWHRRMHLIAEDGDFTHEHLED